MPSQSLNQLFLNLNFEQQCQLLIDWQARQLTAYDIFDLDEECHAKDINTAYRRLSLKFHPDRVAAEFSELATGAFKTICNAKEFFDIIANPGLSVAEKIKNCFYKASLLGQGHAFSQDPVYEFNEHDYFNTSYNDHRNTWLWTYCYNVNGKIRSVYLHEYVFSSNPRLAKKLFSELTHPNLRIREETAAYFRRKIQNDVNFLNRSLNDAFQERKHFRLRDLITCINQPELFDFMLNHIDPFSPSFQNLDVFQLCIEAQHWRNLRVLIEKFPLNQIDASLSAYIHQGFEYYKHYDLPGRGGYNCLINKAVQSDRDNARQRLEFILKEFIYLDSPLRLEQDISVNPKLIYYTDVYSWTSSEEEYAFIIERIKHNPSLYAYLRHEFKIDPRIICLVWQECADIVKEELPMCDEPHAPFFDSHIYSRYDNYFHMGRLDTYLFLALEYYYYASFKQPQMDVANFLHEFDCMHFDLTMQVLLLVSNALMFAALIMLNGLSIMLGVWALIALIGIELTLEYYDMHFKEKGRVFQIYVPLFSILALPVIDLVIASVTGQVWIPIITSYLGLGLALNLIAFYHLGFVLERIGHIHAYLNEDEIKTYLSPSP